MHPSFSRLTSSGKSPTGISPSPSSSGLPPPYPPSSSSLQQSDRRIGTVMRELSRRLLLAGGPRGSPGGAGRPIPLPPPPPPGLVAAGPSVSPSRGRRAPSSAPPGLESGTEPPVFMSAMALPAGSGVCTPPDSRPPARRFTSQGLWGRRYAMLGLVPHNTSTADGKRLVVCISSRTSSGRQPPDLGSPGGPPSLPQPVRK